MAFEKLILHPIDLFQMPLDLACGHPSGIHRQNLVIETRKSPLVLRYDLGLEFPLPIARNFDFYFTEVPLELLPAHSISRVAAAATFRVVLLVAELVG